MKNKILIYSRLIISFIVFILSGLAFYGHFYPLKIFDLQFTTALQNGLLSGFGLGLFLFFTIILLTLLFGRIYCSMLCPLGIYQEILTILFKPFYKKRLLKPMQHYVFAYFLAAILLGTLCGGTVVWLRLLDPYALTGSALSGAWYGVGFMVALAILVFCKKRFFCTNICPVGAVLGIISRFSLFKIRFNEKKCGKCGLCTGVCPCGAIDAQNGTVNNETCIKCFNCLNYCRHTALSYGLSPTKPVSFSSKRRQLLVSSAVVILFGVACRGGIVLAQKVASKVKKMILPAGAKNVEDFANRCSNCNLCVANCPLKIIKPADEQTPFVHLTYDRYFCDFNCHKCSEVCPSGAIKRITLAQKRKTKIANAVVNKDVCIKCGLCKGECPRHIVEMKTGDFPQIHAEKCIGCGACAMVCPVHAIRIEPVDQQITLT